LLAPEQPSDGKVVPGARIRRPTIDGVTGPEPTAHWLGGVDRWNRTHGWASDVLLAVALLAVFGALSVGSAQGLYWQRGWLIGLIAAFGVLHVTVAFRQHAPEVAYLVASAALLVIALAPDARVVHPVSGGPTRVPAPFVPSSLVFLVLLYSVAARANPARSRSVLVIALAGVGIMTGTTADTLRQLVNGSWLIVFYVGVGLALIVVSTWSLGRFALVRRLRAVTERAEAARFAVLEERGRIAREMHDIVAHSLAVIVRQAEGGAFVAEQDPSGAGRALRTIADAGRSALSDMRGLLGVLHEPEADPGAHVDAGAVPAAPRPTLADLPRLVAGVRDSGVDVWLSESGARFAVGPATELAVYRLAQEGLTNAVKHAGPGAQVGVALCWAPDGLTVAVVDDGGEVPVPMPMPVPGTGAGLQGMRERVAAVGGTFSVAPGDRGFQVRARFPRVTQSSEGPG
jgi:signal transduction histidine kinase